MRFFSAALLALASTAQARKLTHEDLNNMVDAGKIDKEQLLRQAIPADRHLEDQYQYYVNENDGNSNNGQNYNENWSNQENQDYQGNQDNEEDVQEEYYGQGLPLTGNYTVRFNKCMSFSVQDTDITDDEDLLSYAQTGSLVAQRSYILFDVQKCEPGSCVFDESDLSKIYMVPLDKFVASMVEYYPNKRETYCNACQNHYDYCSGDYGYFYDTATFMNGGSYCLNGDQYEMINCHRCGAYGCLGGNYVNQQYDQWDQVGAWVQNMAECQQTEYFSNSGANLYTGLMCNKAGDGVEFGVFLDDECSQFYKAKSAINVMSNDDYMMLYNMPSVVEYMFTSSISCRDEDEVTYINAFQPVYGDGQQQNYNYQNNNNGDYEDWEDWANDNNQAKEGNTCELGEEVNQSCQDLFQDNENAYSLNDCLNGNTEWNQNYNNDVDTSSVNSLWRSSGLYNFDMDAQTAQDDASACRLVAKQYVNRQHNNVDWDDTSLFNYEKNGADGQGDVVVNAWGKKDSALSAGEKFVFYLFGIVAVALVGVGGYRVYKSRDDNVVEVESDRDLPLMT